MCGEIRSCRYVVVYWILLQILDERLLILSCSLLGPRPPVHPRSHSQPSASSLNDLIHLLVFSFLVRLERT